jgi:hypothetical protein
MSTDSHARRDVPRSAADVGRLGRHRDVPLVGGWSDRFSTWKSMRASHGRDAATTIATSFGRLFSGRAPPMSAESHDVAMSRATPPMSADSHGVAMSRAAPPMLADSHARRDVPHVGGWSDRPCTCIDRGARGRDADTTIATSFDCPRTHTADVDGFARASRCPGQHRRCRPTRTRVAMSPTWGWSDRFSTWKSMSSSRGRERTPRSLRASSDWSRAEHRRASRCPAQHRRCRPTHARRDVPHVGLVRPILHVEIDELVAWP